MTIASRHFLLGILAVIVVVASGAYAQVPNGVSPGAVDYIAAIEKRCPAFSWGVAPDTEHYQLVCYQLPEGMEPSEVDMARAEQVLYTEIPGAATSWTPNLSQCLTPGESYVWFVRAVFAENHGEQVDASEWSYGKSFEISAEPSAGEVEDALRVLRRYVGDGDGGADPVDPHERETGLTRAERSDAGRRPVPRSQGQKSVPLAKTAIRGSLSDTMGETYGVVGVSASTDGAGLRAVHNGCNNGCH